MGKNSLLLLALVGTFAVYQLALLDTQIVANILDQQFQKDINQPTEQREQSLFQRWSQLHNQIYYSMEERSYRFSIFSQKIKKIQAHNDLSKSFKMGLNAFSDMTFEQFSSMYLTLNQPSRKIDNFQSFQLKSLPDSIDWNEQGSVTPIKDQGKCGSCWSFSATGALQGYWFSQTKNLVSLSEQQLMDCSRQFGNRGCSGGWMDWAFDYVWDNKIMKESDYPYVGLDQVGCNIDDKKALFSISGYQYVKHNDLDQLKAALSQNVVSVSIAVSQQLVDYQSGVYDGTSAELVNHGVLAVGYGRDENTKTDYWKVKNSWGVSWGESGFFRLKRESGTGSGQSLIGTQPVFPI